MIKMHRIVRVMAMGIDGIFTRDELCDRTRHGIYRHTPRPQVLSAVNTTLRRLKNEGKLRKLDDGYWEVVK